MVEKKNTKSKQTRKTTTASRNRVKEQNRQVMELNSKEEINLRESSLKPREGELNGEAAQPPRGCGWTAVDSLALTPAQVLEGLPAFF